MNKDNISISTERFFMPLLAGSILNAYYLALILKKQEGIEITPDIENETMVLVMKQWARVQLDLQSAFQSLEQKK